jgi:hypothetical protein
VIIAIMVSVVLALHQWSWGIEHHVRQRGDDLHIFRETAHCLWTTACRPYAPLSGYAPDLLIPHGHVLLWPLDPFSQMAASAIWLTVSALAFVAALWLAADTLRLRFSIPESALIVVLCFSAGFAVAGIRTGQIYAAMTLPLTLAWRWDRSRSHPVGVGLIVGVLATLKPLLLLLGLWFLWRRDWRAAAATASSSLLLTLVGLAAFGLEAHRAWFGSMRQVVNSGHLWDGSILQTMTRWFGASFDFVPIMMNPDLAANLASALMILVLGVTFWRVRPGDQGWLVILSAAVLLSPKGWLTAAPWLIGPAVGVWIAGDRKTRILLGIAAVFAYLPAHTVTVLGQPNGWLTILNGSLVFWMFLLTWMAGVTAPAVRVPSPGQRTIASQFPPASSS